MDKGRYEEHEQRAWDRYVEHVLTCSHGPTEDQYYQREDEVRMQADDFEEHCFQIKMVEGMVKIKWETPCTWVGCPWHLYYCKMIEAPVWESPFTIAQRRDSS